MCVVSFNPAEIGHNNNIAQGLSVILIFWRGFGRVDHFKHPRSRQIRQLRDLRIHPSVIYSFSGQTLSCNTKKRHSTLHRDHAVWLKMRLIGIDPTPQAPEAGALSTELQTRLHYHTTFRFI